jgi:hypothetical protein
MMNNLDFRVTVTGDYTVLTGPNGLQYAMVQTAPNLGETLRRLSEAVGESISIHRL